MKHNKKRLRNLVLTIKVSWFVNQCRIRPKRTTPLLNRMRILSALKKMHRSNACPVKED